MPTLWMPQSRRSLQGFQAGGSGARRTPPPDPRATASGTSRSSIRAAPSGCTRTCLSSQMVRRMPPLVLFWEWDLPQTVVIHWTGSEYEAIATYQIGEGLPEEEELSLEERRAEHSAGIDMGEVHPAVSCDGEHSHLLNGRLLRSKRQYRNKLMAKMDAKISRCKKGGKRRRKLILANQKRLSKLKHQIQAIYQLAGI